MLGVLVGLLKTVGVNLVGMFVGPKMIIWLLGTAAKASDNDVDDNIVSLVEGAYNKDQKQVKSAVSKLMASFRRPKTKE